MRVLKWILDRCEGSGGAVKSPIGFLPGIHDLDLAELEIDHKCVDELLEVDHNQWETELAEHKKFFDSLGGVVPEELRRQREEVEKRFAE
jgi:phosphoenolpyruvate carboxykinase (GTP)